MTRVLLTRQGRGLLFEQSAPLAPHLSTPYEVIMHALSVLKPGESQWWGRAHAFTDLAPELAITPATWGLMKVAGKRLYHCEPDDLDARINEIDLADLERVEPQVIEAWWSALEARERPSIGPNASDQQVLVWPERFESVLHARDHLMAWVAAHNEALLKRGAGEELSRDTPSQGAPSQDAPSQDDPSQSAPQSERRWRGARRVVGALALSPELECLGYALNRPELGSTAHAEWLLLDQLLTQLTRSHTSSVETLGSQITLISSLKPCKMCAGAWSTYWPIHKPDSSLDVYFVRDDPGANGQNTAFDEGSYAWERALERSRERSRSCSSDLGSVRQSQLASGSPGVIDERSES